MNSQRKPAFIQLVRPIAAVVFVSAGAVAVADTPQITRAGVEYSPPKVELSASDLSLDSIKSRLQSTDDASGSDAAAKTERSTYVELPSANRSGHAPFDRPAALPSGRKSMENEAKDGRGAQDYVPEPMSATSIVDETRTLAASLLATRGTRETDTGDRSGVPYVPVRYGSFGEWWDAVSN